MNKQNLLPIILKELEQKLNVILQAARNAREEATHEDAKAENKYDTRGLEASYLAGAQAKRAVELEKAVIYFDNLIKNYLESPTFIAANALVKLRSEETSSWYYLSPYEGGLKVKCENEEVLVLGAQSPLGKALLKKVEGEVIEINTPLGLKEYEVCQIL